MASSFYKHFIVMRDPQAFCNLIYLHVGLPTLY